MNLILIFLILFSKVTKAAVAIVYPSTRRNIMVNEIELTTEITNRLCQGITIVDFRAISVPLQNDGFCSRR